MEGTFFLKIHSAKAIPYIILICLLQSVKPYSEGVKKNIRTPELLFQEIWQKI